MEHGIIWEELGDHFIHRETGAQRRRALPGLQTELRLEAGAPDLLAWKTCVCVCVGGRHPLHPSAVSSLAWRGGCMWDPDSMVGS